MATDSENERLRLEMLVRRDGVDAAREWARRAAALYRGAISDPGHFASQPDWKPRFEQLIFELEQFADRGVTEVPTRNQLLERQFSTASAGHAFG